MAGVSCEKLWKQSPAHWHRKMTSATEPEGVHHCYFDLKFDIKLAASKIGSQEALVAELLCFKDPALIAVYLSCLNWDKFNFSLQTQNLNKIS